MTLAFGHRQIVWEMAYAKSSTENFIGWDFRIENLSIVTSIGKVNARQVREVIIDKWDVLFEHLNNGTVLFIAGIHGNEDGTLGDFSRSVEQMMNQVKIGLVNFIGQLRSDI